MNETRHPVLKRIKGLLTKVVLVLLGVLLSLIVAEGLLRASASEYAPQPPLFYHQYSSSLGWEGIPNATGMLIRREFTVSQSFNSKGIRGPEYSYTKGDNEYRILILGDSIAEGYGVEFDELFSEVLKRELNNKGNGYYYEVISTGTSGYSTDQELLFFQAEGKNYRPDLTILMFHENDVWQNSIPGNWPYHKPLFALEDGRLSLTNVPVPKLDAPPRQEAFLQDIKRWLGEKSYLYTFIARKVRETPFLYPLAIKLGLADNPNDETGFAPMPDYFRVWKKTYDADIRYAWKLTDALIVKLREETASIGSELLVFNIPRKESIYVDDWQATKRKYGISDDDWNIDQAGIELNVICKRNNIDCVNPTTLLRVDANKLETVGRRLYFIYDGHWTVDGHETAGEILAEHINSGYLANRK